jgi:hypothetical protein
MLTNNNISHNFSVNPFNTFSLEMFQTIITTFKIVRRKIKKQNRSVYIQNYFWQHGESGELRDLYSSPSITRIIMSRSMRWMGHVVRMG